MGLFSSNAFSNSSAMHLWAERVGVQRSPAARVPPLFGTGHRGEYRGNMRARGIEVTVPMYSTQQKAVHCRAVQKGGKEKG